MADGQVQQGYAGGIVLNLNNAAIGVLCVDLFTHIAIDDTLPVDFILPQYLNSSDPSRGLRAAYLYVTQYANITNSADGAALQLAIWDIVHDGGDGFSAGRLQASTNVGSETNTAIRDAALQFIQVSLNYQTDPQLATIFRHVDGPYAKQQLIGAYLPGTGEPIPEPSTVALIGCGLGVVAWRGRRRQRSASSN